MQYRKLVDLAKEMNEAATVVATDHTDCDLPDGEYTFCVTDVEFGEYPGGKSVPPCAKAIVTLRLVNTNLGEAVKIRESFFSKGLVWKTEQLINAVDVSKTNFWDNVVGSWGRCQTEHRQYISQETGTMRTSINVKEFLPRNKQHDSGAQCSLDEMPF